MEGKNAMSAESIITELSEEVRTITQSPGVAAIAAERLRQLARFDPGYDDKAYENGDLAFAASAYVGEVAQIALNPDGHMRKVYRHHPPRDWPWGKKWWKPTNTTRMLEKAGGLIAAELDRRARKKARGQLR